MGILDHIKHWWATSKCNRCGERKDAQEVIGDIYLGLHGKYCRACRVYVHDVLDKQEHERKVQKELEALRAKEEARVRFEVERGGTYREAPVQARVEECSTCAPVREFVDACMDCGYKNEAHNGS